MRLLPLYLIITILIAFSGITSCGSGEGNNCYTTDSLHLSGTVLAGDEAFREPLGIVASDDRIYIRNSVKYDTVIDEYTLGGEYIRSFLKKGIESGQLPYLTGMWYDAAAHRLVVESDVARGKLLAVEGLDSATPALRMVTSLRERIVGAPDDTVVPASLMLLGNGAVYAPNLNSAGMLNAYDRNGRLKKIAVHYPDVIYQSGVPAYGLANFFHLSGRVSPDGKHFAASSALGDVLVLGTADADSATITVITGEPQKGIEIDKEEDGYASFRYTDSLRYFYPGGVIVSDNHVYTAVGDYASAFTEKKRDMATGNTEPLTTVRVYDYSGRLAKVLYLKAGRCLLAVKPDDSAIYALEESDEFGYRLLQFNL